LVGIPEPIRAESRSLGALEATFRALPVLFGQSQSEVQWDSLSTPSPRSGGAAPAGHNAPGGNYRFLMYDTLRRFSICT
jgi:hypothetical protein